MENGKILTELENLIKSITIPMAVIHRGRIIHCNDKFQRIITDRKLLEKLLLNTKDRITLNVKNMFIEALKIRVNSYDLLMINDVTKGHLLTLYNKFIHDVETYNNLHHMLNFLMDFIINNLKIKFFIYLILNDKMNVKTLTVKVKDKNINMDLFREVYLLINREQCKMIMDNIKSKVSNLEVYEYMFRIKSDTYHFFVGYEYFNDEIKSLISSFLDCIFKYVKLLIINLYMPDLEKKLHELERFSYRLLQFLHHDFLTPLTIIKLNAEVLRECYNEKYIIKILKNTHKLSNYIKRILQAAEIYRKAILGLFEIERVNIKELIGKILRLYKEEISKKNLRVINNAKDLVIKTMREALEKALIEIIENAIRYNKENGYIKIDTKVVNNYLEIMIEDSGIGISEEKLKYLIMPFSIDTEYTKVYYTTGMGLFIAKSLLHAIGGTFKIESKVNKGTKVLIRIRF